MTILKEFDASSEGEYHPPDSEQHSSGGEKYSLDGEKHSRDEEQHSRDVEQHPSCVNLYVGMIFSSYDEAYDCYNSFAECCGFSIKKFTTRFTSGVITRRYYTCSMEGFKRKFYTEKVVKHRIDERCGCLARLIIEKQGGNGEGWVVSELNNDHNHVLLSTPSKIKVLRSHNKSHLKNVTRALVNDLYDCNIGPAQSAKILNTVLNDPKVHVTAKQCGTILTERRKNNVGSQCSTIIHQFFQRQSVDRNFFYAIEVDEDATCRSLFWADGRARESYLKFSDVVVFDVTYKTNSFLLPFAPFTGVNHHFQSTLFGCALLADEKEDTFVWLFQNWLRCMYDKAPGAIITDQDPAICKAIEHVFPNTHHRYCIWHITLHEDEHLRPLRVAYGSEFNHDYGNWKRNCITIEESEIVWKVLNEKYRNYNTGDKKIVDENWKSKSKAWKWLDYMYAKRRHWVDAYLKGVFFAGMKSSQRSESMNAFFDGFVRSKTPLHEFVLQYENAVIAQREKEDLEDKVCLTSNPIFKGMHEFEGHAGRFYTRKLFELFQKEFKEVFFCNHKIVACEGCCTTYMVSSRIDGIITSNLVITKIDTESFTCTCAKFETMGILCKHVLYVMKQVYDLVKIPEKYLLGRWSLHCRYNTPIKLQILEKSHDITNRVGPLESWRLRVDLNEILELADRNREFHDYVSNAVIKIRDHFEPLLRIDPNANDGDTNAECSQPPLPKEMTIFDPKKITHKGRPTQATRFKSGIEKVMNDMKKRSRTCSSCGEKGHDVRTCNSND